MFKNHGTWLCLRRCGLSTQFYLTVTSLECIPHYDTNGQKEKFHNSGILKWVKTIQSFFLIILAKNPIRSSKTSYLDLLLISLNVNIHVLCRNTVMIIGCYPRPHWEYRSYSFPKIWKLLHLTSYSKHFK